MSPLSLTDIQISIGSIKGISKSAVIVFLSENSSYCPLDMAIKLSSRLTRKKPLTVLLFSNS